MLPKIVRMCETEYRTGSQGQGFVRARHCTTRKIHWVNWDHALDAEENHIAAAVLALGRRPEFRTSVDGGGYLFGVDPANDPQEPRTLLEAIDADVAKLAKRKKKA